MTNRQRSLWILGLAIMLSTGCSMCCGPYDYHYPTFGGRVQRVNPEYGRVGSIYSDPTADPGTSAITNTQLPDRERPKSNQELDFRNGESSAIDVNYRQPSQDSRRNGDLLRNQDW
ncbi:MAG TPA: hypothetical protein PKD64_06985 [Pirellulaceae bacterium]|nr:hypothetical protein [Pirellulaceae bacterium]HMO91928.1 hypothetical protein [Pirellulaceae bacterium]HMP68727.1 hypothetical protein [Pirellulaceae bacterium]